jgi:peptidylprolyl isomerase
MKKFFIILLTLGLLLFVFYKYFYQNQNNKVINQEGESMESKIMEMWPNAKKTASGLMYVVHKPGTGLKPVYGNVIATHYTGRLIDGKKFDSSVDRDEPFIFKVGVGQVIKGWDEAFLDMKEGEKRTIMLPYQLAYGENGYPPVIPPKAWLIFDVELLEIKN